MPCVLAAPTWSGGAVKLCWEGVREETGHFIGEMLQILTALAKFW